MPFTLSHPAAVLPLARYRLPLSALVIGSMAPDFPYFLRWTAEDRFGHTIPGLFFYCVPIGFLVLLTFHGIMKIPMLSLLPTGNRLRLLPIARRFRFGPLPTILFTVLALLLGAVTHLIWDSFTHENGWSVRHCSVLQTPLVHTPLGTLHVYKLLQHGSSVVGAIVLIAAYRGWYQQATEDATDLPLVFSDTVRVRVLTAIFLAAFAIAGLYGLFAVPLSAGHEWLHLFASRFVLSGMAILVVELLLFSALWHFKAAGSKPVTNSNQI